MDNLTASTPGPAMTWPEFFTAATARNPGFWAGLTDAAAGRAHPELAGQEADGA